MVIYNELQQKFEDIIHEFEQVSKRAVHSCNQAGTELTKASELLSRTDDILFRLLQSYKKSLLLSLSRNEKNNKKELIDSAEILLLEIRDNLNNRRNNTVKNHVNR